MNHMLRKRLIVLILAAIVAGLLYYMWSIGDAGNRSPLVMGAVIIGVALLYVLRGSLPKVVYHVLINRDDDPSNVSPRVYVPILIAAFLIAAALFLWTLAR
jgi:hypothetical protein